MAKNRTSNGLGRIAGACAFIALMISGIIYTINFLLGIFKAEVSFGIIGTIANVCLIIAVILSAWMYKISQKWAQKLWITILFWVFAILALVGTIGINFL